MKTKLAGMGGAPAQTFVDDVFSTTLYTGNGSTQTITNGIDLAGKGGLVWCKSRSSALSNMLVDTARGIQLNLSTDTTGAQSNPVNSITQFNNNGFNLGARTGTNDSAVNFASWTFRKAAKFFDVVTYTGNGVNGRAISHNLGIAPGMIIVKSTSNASNWVVYHQSLSLPTNKTLRLNTTSAELTGGYFPTLPTSSVFYTNGDGYEVNNTGQTYVAYLYAHDTSSTGIIQCGSFTTDAGGNATVSLGWEPQFYIVKRAVGGAEGWEIEDTMRNLNANYYAPNSLFANTLAAEAPYTSQNITATGFKYNYSSSATYIYMAIRRPNKPPTTGTQVFSPFVGSDASTITTGFPVDMLFDNKRAGNSNNTVNASRLVGEYSLITSSTAAETVGLVDANCFQNNTGYLPNALGTGIVSYAFKRAPGFFDVVCYTGTGSATTQAHNLTVVPELMIVKNRSVAGYSWVGYDVASGNTKAMLLNTTGASTAYAPPVWNNTSPTATVFSVGTSPNNNTSGATYVAYLFATLAGISKVGSYTGNGGTQNIDCGFAAGARFVLIKRTDSTGDWYVWDTARGIVSANDPHLSLNTTAAEVTTDDSVDPYAAGFAVNQVAATNINVSSATYIFLAIA